MRILALDDERAALNILVRAIKDALPEAELSAFEQSASALEVLENGGFCPDMAFLDIEMPDINGLSFSENLKRLCPKCNIVFVTGYSKYALDAMSIRPSGYVMKPISREKILAEMENLRHPLPKIEPKKLLDIQCFGNFEVFAQGRPVKFTRSKTKELLAFLTDRRGARVNGNEIIAVLWEDKPDSDSTRSYFRNTVADLTAALEAVGAGEVLHRANHSYALRVDLVSCDYYDYLNVGSAMPRAFCGEYMNQYSWAEATAAALEHSGAK